MAEIVVVGAGPAGIAAAEVLVADGQRVTLLDEAAQAGGQGYRKPSPGLTIDMTGLMGSEAGKYARLHARFERLRPQPDYRPGTLVWAMDGDCLHVLTGGRVWSGIEAYLPDMIPVIGPSLTQPGLFHASASAATVSRSAPGSASASAR